VSYAFFKVDAAFRRLAPKEQTDLKLELIKTIRGFQRRMLVQAYSLVGMRGDVDFLLWQVAEEVEDFNALGRAMLSAAIGPYLHTPYSLLGMTRKSIYDIGLDGPAAEERLVIQPGHGKYLFVYPFVASALRHPRAGQDPGPGRSPQDRDAVALLAHRLVNRMFHHLATRIKSGASAADAEAYLNALSFLFDDSGATP